MSFIRSYRSRANRSFVSSVVTLTMALFSGVGATRPFSEAVVLLCMIVFMLSVSASIALATYSIAMRVEAFRDVYKNLSN